MGGEREREREELDRVLVDGWLVGGGEAASVRTDGQGEAADGDTVRDENHLEAVSQRRRPPAICPGLGDPL